MAFFLILLAGIATPLIYGYALRTNIRWGQAWLVMLIPLGIAAAFYLVFALGGLGFFGVLYCIIFAGIAVVALVAMLVERTVFLRQPDSTPQQHRWALTGIFLIPALLCSPIPWAYTIQGGCNALDRQIGDTVVMAIDAYWQDHGSYPEELNHLTPDYLSHIPTGRCSAVGDAPQAFDIQQCHTGETILVINVMTDEWIQRYNLETGRWSRASFLDGACSFLR